MLEVILGGLLAYNLFFTDDDSDTSYSDNSGSSDLNTLGAGYISKYTGSDADTFLPKLLTVAATLAVDPNALAGVIFEESKMIPTAFNASSGASGLLQFEPATAKSLNTDTTSILQMEGTAQLDYILTYLSQFNINSNNDLFFAVFFPAAIGKADDWVLSTPTLSAEKIAAENPGIAKGKTQITVADAKAYIAPFFSAT